MTLGHNYTYYFYIAGDLLYETVVIEPDAVWFHYEKAKRPLSFSLFPGSRYSLVHHYGRYRAPFFLHATDFLDSAQLVFSFFSFVWEKNPGKANINGSSKTSFRM